MKLNIVKLFIASSALTLGTGCGSNENTRTVNAPKSIENRSQNPANIGTDDEMELGDIVETAAEAGSFSTLLAAATEAGLVETLKSEGPFTVFAPSDEAFDKIPEETLQALLADKEALKDVLLYHVVPGKVTASEAQNLAFAKMANDKYALLNTGNGQVKIQESLVTAADVNASNGVIHVIDTVILPPKDIVGVASDAGIFKTLLTAAGVAELESTLQGPGPFTVFAPNDEAFAKIPEETLNDLLADKEALKNVLLYHVVADYLPASQVVSKTSLTMANSAKTTIVLENNEVQINDATVKSTNITAANGIVHVIDTVILPQ